jgi:HAMP domain-containing protein
MPLTERSRHKLYETFTALIDDETAVQEMLSYFPARDVEEPVTKDFLRAELQSEVGAVRLEVGELRAELHTEIGALRTEMHTEIGAVRAEIGDLRAEVHQMARATQTWIISTGLSLAGLILAVARFG